MMGTVGCCSAVAFAPPGHLLVRDLSKKPGAPIPDHTLAATKTVAVLGAIGYQTSIRLWRRLTPASSTRSSAG